MRYKKTPSIGILLQKLFYSTPYREQLITIKIMEACKQTFPFLENQLQRFYIKDHIVYMKLHSSVLTHELRLNKRRFMLRMQEACDRMDHGDTLQNMVKSVVFL